MSFTRAAMLAVALLASAPASASMAELTFWTAVRDSKDPAELKAYLDAFPDGTFAELARIRIAALTAGTAPGGTPASAPTARISVDRSEFDAVERIPIAVDATALRNYTNLTVVAVPAAMPDEILPEMVAALGVRVGTGYVRTTLPPIAGGADPFEARLYAIAPYESTLKVVARASFSVAPTPEGAVLVEDLARDARSRGAIGFEAAYRDVKLRVSGQFLRAASGIDEASWVEVLTGNRGEAANYVVLMVGHLGDPAPESMRNEIACIVAADDGEVLTRIAELSVGDAVLVEGRGSTSSRSTLATAAVVSPALSASSAWVSAFRVRRLFSLSPTYTTAACMLATSLFAYR